VASSNLDEVRHCPHSPKLYYVIYDGGTTPDLPLLVCKSCFEKPLYQKFVKNKNILSKKQQLQNSWEDTN